MATVRTSWREARVLDFDCECLPGHWIAADYVSKILTAAAWQWIDEGGEVEVRTHYDTTAEDIARELADVIAQADMVAGHYIRGFDLRLVNGNLLRAEEEPLGKVLAHDTKLDLHSTHGRSLSQENLAAMLGIAEPKVKVTLYEWEAFNTRVPGFRDKGIERVRGDVLQNIAMRRRLLELGWLEPPKVWSGASRRSGRYHV
jgi:hypothetical protein